LVQPPAAAGEPIRDRQVGGSNPLAPTNSNGLRTSAFGFRLPDMRREDRGDRAHDFVLYFEHGRECSIVVFGPAVRSSLGVDQLRRNPQPITGPSDAALQHTPHAEFAPD